MEPKPKILVAVFCGSERHHWLNPSLVRSLLQMQTDSRFSVSVEMIYSLQPTDYARNTAVALARSKGVDWLLMIDSDTAPNVDPLTVIATAPSSADVVSLIYGSCLDGSTHTVCADIIPGVTSGDFFGVRSLGTGSLALRSSVWQKLKVGPWFKVQQDEADELRRPTMTEDIYFCNLARAVGLSIWLHGKATAAHFHSTDLTGLVPRK